jgi:hypothetical protein
LKASRDAENTNKIFLFSFVRNITFELCAWGFGNVETFGSQMSHLWRTSQDIAGSIS